MSKSKKVWKRIIKIIFATIITIAIVVGAFAIYMVKTIKPYSIDLDNVKMELSGTAVQASEESTPAILELKNNKNRIWVNLSDVPKNLTNAIISTEDKSFYLNNGVDFSRTFKAVVNAVFQYDDSIGGGSTITQQVIKNIEGNINDRSYKIKLKEIVTAPYVAHQYSKDQIIETYINIVTFGNGCYGVQAASKHYFGKDIKDLDLAQCATLACVLPSPNQLYDPYKNPENVHERRNFVLENMLNQGMITEEQFTEAVNETVSFMQE